MKELWISGSNQEDPQELPRLKWKGRQIQPGTRKSSPPERGNDIWLLTLSDLLLLLMVFFVILFGLTLQQKNLRADLPGLPAEKATKQEDIRQEKPTASPEESKPKEVLASLEKELQSTLEEKDRKGQITIARRADNLFLIFPETIVFDPGQAQLKPSSRSILEKVASLVSSHPQLLVEVQGHTDDRPIHNQRYPSNWELSVDRAMQVVKTLISLGLNPVQISGRGFGEYRPLHSNHSAENRNKNRRVEIQFSLPPSS